MRTVLITIPGDGKAAFAEALKRELGDTLALTVIEARARRRLATWRRTLLAQGLRGLVHELAAALQLRLSLAHREALGYFTPDARTVPPDVFPTPTLVTANVNDDAVYEAVRALAPDLLVVWGTGMLDERLVKTAKRAINLHFGLCPYYRGALANQLAVLDGAPERIGATVHELSPTPDAGPVLATITPDPSLPPRALFDDLRSRAAATYLSTVRSLASGQSLPATPQDLTTGKSLRLADWTPRRRLAVARAILAWEAATDTRAATPHPPQPALAPVDARE